MNLDSEILFRAHLEVSEKCGRGDDTRIDGRLTVVTPFGYSLRFSFRDMSVTTMLGSRGIGEVRLDGDVVNGTTASFVSGLIIQMVVEDVGLRAYVQPPARPA